MVRQSRPPDRDVRACWVRQLSPMASRVDVDSIVDEVAQRIVDGVGDDRLTWLGDRRVRVEVGRIFPDQSGYKQTVQGRRRRLREALIERLSIIGWSHYGRNTFGLGRSESDE